MSKLITNAYFRSECDVSANIEDKDIDNPIKRSQETLRMILGEDFYTEIITQYNANTLTTANTAVYDPYIKQFIAWQAYEIWLSKANVNQTRSGIRIHIDESSQVATDKQMGELLKSASGTTALYKGLLMTFLKKNYTNYPLYDSCNNQAFGTGFQITSISRKDPTYYRIDKEKYNEY